MRLLIIEDKADDVRGILDHAEERGWENKQLDFREAILAIDEYDPDVIVLDMKDDETQDEHCGGNIFKLIWKNRFRPTIIFSGLADSFVIDDPEIQELAKDPLFVSIPKGDEAPVIAKLDYLADIVPSISRLRQKLNTALIASADAINAIKTASSGISQEVLDYLFASRITQFLQAPVFEQKLPAWVQYIFPPMGEHLLVGDILSTKTILESEGEQKESIQFAIVLSPSCDLARADSDTKVLVTHATKFSSIDSAYTNNFSKDEKKYKDRRERMGKVLNQGFSGSKLYLPAITGVFPDLCFDMKDIDIIRLGDIATSADKKSEGQSWERIASLASPYRERAVWAYLSTACRPGVPTLDTDGWVDKIYS